jgi:hypothetical protein
VCAALPALRRKEARAAGGVGPASFRVPAGNVVAAVGMAGSLILATRMSVREVVTMSLVLALATGYWIASHRRP